MKRTNDTMGGMKASIPINISKETRLIAIPINVSIKTRFIARVL
jgi:hypothetical protein